MTDGIARKEGGANNDGRDRLCSMWSIF